MSERFLQSPNFPKSQVTHIIMSDYQPMFKEELEKAGICIEVPDILPMITGSEKYHADMSVCHIGGDRIFRANMIDTEITAERPSLNICIFGKYAVCNTKTAYRPILDILHERGIVILHTNQSYAKCSCALVNENALITSDPSIYRLCVDNDIDVLPISVGGIRLDGYEYGFIGGCCGLIDEHTLAFTGNTALHKDYQNIRAFARNYHTEILSLGNDILYDIGGILPIKEISN